MYISRMSIINNDGFSLLRFRSQKVSLFKIGPLSFKKKPDLFFLDSSYKLLLFLRSFNRTRS